MNQSLDVERQETGAGHGEAERAVTVSHESPGASERLERRVLIVDDEASVLTSLRRLLRRESYELVVANSGEEALRLLEEQPVPVVISDQRMPGMTGIEFLHEVRRHWPNTIRIILSGYSAVQTIIAAINEGAVYKFLSKPWNDEELKGNIRHALHQYELEEENRRMGREIAEQNKRLRQLNVELDQRAADASAGLNSIQDLQEAIAVGVITFDESELIVAANRLAGQMLANGAELLGMPAGDILPDEVYQALFAEGINGKEGSSGRLDHGERKLQWRLQPVRADDSLRGRVVTIWEDVP